MDAAATRLAAGTATSCQIFQEDMPGQVGSLQHTYRRGMPAQHSGLIMLQILQPCMGQASWHSVLAKCKLL